MSTRNEVEAALSAAWIAADHLEATSPQQRHAIKSPIEVALNSLPAPLAGDDEDDEVQTDGGSFDGPTGNPEPEVPSDDADAPKKRPKKDA